MLRRPKTITASRTAPKSLKPQRARQLIRRFHNLNKTRENILRLLAQTTTNLLEDNYRALLGDQYTQGVRLFDYKRDAATAADENPGLFTPSTPRAQLVAKLAQIDAEIAQRGGLHVYQMASTVGQTDNRGGDSLKWLSRWFEQENWRARASLEIGSLSPLNALSTSGKFGQVTRIDLNSQNPQILQQDFMERPLPRGENDRFDVISCSLVLNFVPTPEKRGNMLRRITTFLREPRNSAELPKPVLFLVLPLPCVSNSRYFDRALLAEIMASLGFSEYCSHEAKKVFYAVYQWHGAGAVKPPVARKKRELHAGAKRNNFYVSLT